MGTVEVPPTRASIARRERRVGKTKETKDVLNKKGLEPKRQRREIDA